MNIDKIYELYLASENYEKTISMMKEPNFDWQNLV